MSTKISALPTTTAAAAADVVPLVQSSTTKQVTVGGMLAAVSGDGSISSSGVLAIGQLTGLTSVVSMLAAALTWGASLTPTIGQSISTTGAGAAFSITAQAAKVGSAAAGGNLVFATGAGDGAGTAGAIQFQFGATVRGSFEPVHGRFTAGGGGTDLKCVIGPTSGFETTQASVFLGPTGTAPSSANYTIASDGSTYAYLNCTGGALGLLSGGATFRLYIDASAGFFVYGSSAAGARYYFSEAAAGALHFGVTETSATIQHDDVTTASATGGAMTIRAQNATGTTSTGGDLVLQPGTGTTSNGKLNLNNIITTTTVGAAGAASAMPTPVGYLNVKINGAALRLAYFN